MLAGTGTACPMNTAVTITDEETLIVLFFIKTPHKHSLFNFNYLNGKQFFPPTQTLDIQKTRMKTTDQPHKRNTKERTGKILFGTHTTYTANSTVNVIDPRPENPRSTRS